MSALKPDPDLPPLVKEVEQKALSGVAEAQHDLAAIYTAGHSGVRQDYPSAVQWFEQDAAQGVPNPA